MGDQAERIVLEAEDIVTPVVDKANAGLERFEKQAESSHAKVVRITDQTRSSVQRLIASLEKQAETYGKSGVEKLISQRDQLLQRYAKEPQAIDAITRSYERMIAVEKEAAAQAAKAEAEAAMAKAAKEAEAALEKQSQAIKAFGNNVAASITNPVQGASGAVTSLLATIGPMGVGVAAGGAALAAFAVAGFEAAKSLGQYGIAIKDAELRTGLTAKQVGQFSFAAKAVGQDISIVERLMRSLSQAADDNSKDGDKARGALERMGVTLHDAAGDMKPTSQILTEISEALNKLPEGLQRDAAAMEIFKRVGIEAVPFMTELTKNLHTAHEEGFGPTEADVQRFLEYQRQVTILETKWDSLVRSFKEGLVIEVSFAGNAAKWLLEHMPGESVDISDQAYNRLQQQGALSQEIRQINAMPAPGPYAPPDALHALQRRRMEALRGLRPEDAFAPSSPEAAARIADAAQWQERIEAEQKRLATSPENPRVKELQAGKEETDRLRAQFFGTHEGMEKAYTQAKNDVEKYQKQLFEPEKPLTKTEVTDLAGKLHTAQADEAKWKATLDAEKDHNEQLTTFRREAAAFEERGDKAELDAVGKIYQQRDLLLQQAAKVKASEAEIAAIRTSAVEQALVAMHKESEEVTKKWDELQLKAAKVSGEFFDKGVTEVFHTSITEATKNLEERGKVFAKLVAENRKLAAAGETQDLAYQKKMVGITGDTSDPMAVLREQQALELTEIKKKRDAALQELSTDPLIAFEQRANAEKEAANAVGELRYQWEEKIAEVRKKADEDQQKAIGDQEKSISRVANKLFGTLLIKPRDFGKELTKDLRDAVTKPMTEGMGNMVAGIIRPVVYGSEGTGGISGSLHGIFGAVGATHDPIKVATDLNTAVTAQNSAAIGMLTAVVGASMGISVPAIGTPGIAGLSGVSIPSISVGAPAGVLSGALGTYGPRFGLPKFADGGVTSGPSIAGEAGPELIIPLDRFHNFGLPPSVQLTGQYGPETDVALEKAVSAMMGVALPAGLSALGGPLGISVGNTFMSMLVGGVGAMTPPRHDNVIMGVLPVGPPGGPRGVADPETEWYWQEGGRDTWGMTAAQRRAASAKGGVQAGITRRIAIANRDPDLDASGMYIGKPVDVPEATHEAAAKLDEQYPWLKDAFKKTEADIQRQEIGRAGAQARLARVRAPRDMSDMRVTPDPSDPYYTARWVIHPKTGEIALTKIGPIDAGKYTAAGERIYGDDLPEHMELIAKKGWPTAGRVYDLMHRGQATIARNGTVLDLGDQSGQGLAEFIATYGTRTGYRPINNDQANQLIKAIAAQFGKLKLPSYDDGGTVGSTGLAVVHKGEAVVPQADSLKKAIDANTEALLQSPDMFNRMLGFFSARVPAMRNPFVEFVTSMASMPRSSGGGFSSAASTGLAGGYTSTSSGTSTGGFTSAPWYGDGGYSGTTAGGYTMAPWAGVGGSTSARMANLPAQLAAMGAKQSPLSSGFSQMGQNLKNSVWSGKEWTSLQNAGYGDFVSGAGAIAKSPAAGAAGMWAAESGLLGSHMGTWEGTAMGAAGGAEIGFQVGGPLGALIGGVAGFGIGLGEKLAGLESPAKKAHDDIKNIYGVDIPQNSGTIRQVVSISQSEFGGDVAVAVRSPKVRQLVMLYSEATGQKMPLSASRPYAGSLVESGGNLYQQASFQNNAWHTYASDLPTLGGISGTQYPTTPGPNTSGGGGGGTYVSLNINGTPITADFVADQSMAAQNASYGRTQQSANLQVPGLMVA